MADREDFMQATLDAERENVALRVDMERLTQERDRLRGELAVALEAAQDGTPDGLDWRT